MLLSLLATPQSLESKEDITKNISSVLSDEKKILEPNQDEKINANLYAGFYTPELKDIENAFVWGNNESFTLAFSKIERRIQNIGQVFGVSYNKQWGTANEKIKGLQSSIASLQNKINSEYNIPPVYIENLQSINKALNNIINQGFGTKTSHGSATGSEEIVEEVQNN